MPQGRYTDADVVAAPTTTPPPPAPPTPQALSTAPPAAPTQGTHTDADVRPTDTVDRSFGGAEHITGPAGLWEQGERWLPAAGATIGSFTPIPWVGAAVGAAAGKGLQTLSGIARRGMPPPPPGPPQSPVQAGLSEAGRQAADMATEAATTGLAQHVGGKVVGKVLSGVMRPVPGSTDAAVAVANKANDLHLGAHEVVPDSVAGLATKGVAELSNFGFLGRTMNGVYERLTKQGALQGAAKGEEAFGRVKKAFNDVVNAGPDYDMLSHKVTAARVFGEQIAPKLLESHTDLPAPVQQMLKVASSGDLSPELAARTIKTTKAAIQKGSKEPIPAGQLDTLYKVLTHADTVKFGTATALRTSLRELGEKDGILGDRATGLNRKFTGDLTEGLSRAYQQAHPAGPDAWDALRGLYAKGAQGLDDSTPSAKLLTDSYPERITAAKLTAQGLPDTVTSRDQAVENLAAINEAMKRRGSDTIMTGGGLRRLQRYMEFGAVGGATAFKGPLVGMGVAALYEALPAAVAWAAHSPTMTKLLTEGFTNADTSVGVASVGRVLQAYVRSQQPSDAPPQAPPSAKGAPPVGPTTGAGGGPLGRGVSATAPPPQLPSR